MISAPEKREYVWERLVRLSYPDAFKIAKGITNQKTQEELNEFLSALYERPKPPKLNGARLKQLLIAAARNAGWDWKVPTPPAPPPKRTSVTDKQCIKCHFFYPLAEFNARITEKLALQRGILRRYEAKGFMDAYGKYQRGHQRTGIMRKYTYSSPLCSVCRDREKAAQRQRYRNKRTPSEQQAQLRKALRSKTLLKV